MERLQSKVERVGIWRSQGPQDHADEDLEARCVNVQQYIICWTSADEGFDGTYHTNVVVRHNGSCLYVPPGIFKSTCKIDITWFPFDDQHCEMKFGSWTYDGNQLNLELKSESGGDLSDFITNGEWYLLANPKDESHKVLGPRCWWPLMVGITRNDAILKAVTEQHNYCFTGSVAGGTSLLKPQLVNVNVIQMRPKTP
ncbi:Neuronal acetylcholine receptor subunit [Homalodisca vitripennis]|nr:Neuronal acetylcholine receptor subunit [Homalodisca vitripennis]